MVVHSVSDGLMVVAKDHPRKKLKAGDFADLDPNRICEEVTLSRSKKLLLVFM